MRAAKIRSDQLARQGPFWHHLGIAGTHPRGNIDLGRFWHGIFSVPGPPRPSNVSPGGGGAAAPRAAKHHTPEIGGLKFVRHPNPTTLSGKVADQRHQTSALDPGSAPGAHRKGAFCVVRRHRNASGAPTAVPVSLPTELTVGTARSGLIVTSLSHTGCAAGRYWLTVNSQQTALVLHRDGAPIASVGYDRGETIGYGNANAKQFVLIAGSCFLSIGVGSDCDGVGCRGPRNLHDLSELLNPSRAITAAVGMLVHVGQPERWPRRGGTEAAVVVVGGWVGVLSVYH